MKLSPVNFKRSLVPFQTSWSVVLITGLLYSLATSEALDPSVCKSALGSATICTGWGHLYSYLWCLQLIRFIFALLPANIYLCYNDSFWRKSNDLNTEFSLSKLFVKISSLRNFKYFTNSFIYIILNKKFYLTNILIEYKV